MTTQETEWSLDTCGCVIRYTWDNTTSENSRTHTVSNYVTKCAAHAGLATDTDRWNCILSENPRKGGALRLCLDNGPTGLFDTIDGSRYLKSGISFNFSWTGTAPNRVLNISFTGITLTTQQKTTIQGFIDSKFGAGKIVLA